MHLQRLAGLVFLRHATDETGFASHFISQKRGAFAWIAAPQKI
jgi:hypothetical protein